MNYKNDALFLKTHVGGDDKLNQLVLIISSVFGYWHKMPVYTPSVHHSITL